MSFAEPHSPAPMTKCIRRTSNGLPWVPEGSGAQDQASSCKRHLFQERGGTCQLCTLGSLAETPLDVGIICLRQRTQYSPPPALPAASTLLSIWSLQCFKRSHTPERVLFFSDCCFPSTSRTSSHVFLRALLLREVLFPMPILLMRNKLRNVKKLA